MLTLVAVTAGGGVTAAATDTTSDSPATSATQPGYVAASATKQSERLDNRRPGACKRKRVCAYNGDDRLANTEGNWYSEAGNTATMVINQGVSGGKDRVRVRAAGEGNSKCLKPGKSTRFGGKKVKLYALEWKYPGCKDKPASH